MTERALPRAISPSPRSRSRSHNPSNTSGIDVDDFRSLCIGSPVPVSGTTGVDASDGFTYDEGKMLDYSDHKQDRLLEKTSRGPSPMCPAITVDKSDKLLNKNSNGTQNAQLPCTSGDYNAESGATSPVSPIMCPPSPTPLDGLAPRSPLQRRAGNSNKYVTYHRSDLAPTAGRGRDHQRGSSFTETTETIHISTTANSRGHTRAETYPPPREDKLKRKPLSDVTSLSSAPPVSPRSKESEEFPLSSVSPQGGTNDIIGGGAVTKDIHRKRVLPAKLAPLNVKATPNVQ